jgi:hypothetical protein
MDAFSLSEALSHNVTVNVRMESVIGQSYLPEIVHIPEQHWYFDLRMQIQE